MSEENGWVNAQRIESSGRLTGSHIDYIDDTGFTADGEFRDGVFYHGGMVLYREEKK